MARAAHRLPTSRQAGIVWAAEARRRGKHPPALRVLTASRQPAGNGGRKQTVAAESPAQRDRGTPKQKRNEGVRVVGVGRGGVRTEAAAKMKCDMAVKDVPVHGAGLFWPVIVASGARKPIQNKTRPE